MEGDPACIVVDEIEAVGKSRLKGNNPGGKDGRERRLNQLLVGVDGFGTTPNVVEFRGRLGGDEGDEISEVDLIIAPQFGRLTGCQWSDSNNRPGLPFQPLQLYLDR